MALGAFLGPFEAFHATTPAEFVDTTSSMGEDVNGNNRFWFVV
jgi:hypothetical protein